MSMFEGKPVYIELTSDKKIYEITTEEILQDLRIYHHSYDIDWCDDHNHYHAKDCGGGAISTNANERYVYGNRVNQQREKLPTYYWAANSLAIKYAEGANPAYYIRLTINDLIPLFLPEKEVQKEFRSLYKIHDESILDLIDHWEQYGFVEEGEVIWCSICQKNMDASQNVPCDHVHWCDECGHFSQPPDSAEEECPHRSEDGRFYVDPEEMERAAQL